MNERKLVEAIKTFFEKSVLPYLGNREEVVAEWRHISNILNAVPIDYGQLDYYLVNKKNREQGTIFANKASTSTQNQQANKQTINKSSFPTIAKKSTLLNSLEAFQALLIRNQERLENLNRQERPAEFNASIPVANNMRRY